MKKTVKAWAHVENGKIQSCDVAYYDSRALCIHDKRMGDCGQKVTTPITITYEIPKRNEVEKSKFSYCLMCFKYKKNLGLYCLKCFKDREKIWGNEERKGKK